MWCAVVLCYSTQYSWGVCVTVFMYVVDMKAAPIHVCIWHLNRMQGATKSFAFMCIHFPQNRFPCFCSITMAVLVAFCCDYFHLFFCTHAIQLLLLLLYVRKTNYNSFILSPFFASSFDFIRRAKYYVDINFADRAFELSHVSRKEWKLEKIEIQWARERKRDTEKEREGGHGC